MSTTVSGILKDAKGQLWVNAPIQFTFKPAPGFAGPYTWSGGIFDKMPATIFTDGTGHFSFSLPANNEIVPSQSTWLIVIGPSATLPAVVLDISLVTGALDISSLFTLLAAPGLAQSLFIPRAYGDAEVIVPPNSGQLYYDTIAKKLKYYEDGAWIPLAAAGSGMIYPGIGIAVSTGTAWGTSIDPATVAYVNKSNTFIGDQHIAGNLQVDAAVIATAGFQIPLKLSIDTNGDASFAGNLSVIGTSILGNLWIGNQGASAPNNRPSIRTTSGGHLVLSPTGNQPLLLNWDGGGNTIIFGDGAGNNKGTVDNGGTLTTGGALNVNGNGEAHNSSFHVAYLSGGAYIDSYGSGAGRGTFNFRIASNSAGLNLQTPLAIEQDGKINIGGNLRLSFNATTLFGAIYDSYGVNTGNIGAHIFHGYNIDGSISYNPLNIYGDHLDSATINCSGGIAVKGSSNFIDGSARLTFDGTMYIDAFGAGGPRGLIKFRQFAAGASSGIESLTFDGAGNAKFVAALGANSIGVAAAGQGCLYAMTDTGAAVDYKTWILEMFAGNTMRWRVVADNGSSDYVFMNVVRSGVHTTNMQFTADNIQMFGNFSSTNKYFLIPDPRDATKDLVHACLEGPENGVFYRGEVRLVNHIAYVDLPDYFEILTFDTDRSVLLTQVLEDELNDDLCVLAAGRIVAGRFLIRGSEKDALVAWEVKAVRKLSADRLQVIRDRVKRPNE